MAMSDESGGSRRRELAVQHAKPPSSPTTHASSEPDERTQLSTRGGRRSRAKSLGTEFTDLTSKFRLRTSSKPSQAFTNRLRDVFPKPYPGIRGTGGLDPFFPLPTTLSERDRGLLHFYLTDLSRIWYSMSRNPVFSIARDIAAPCGAKSETNLSWILLVAENMLRTTSIEEKTARIAGRRASNYRELRLLLENPQTRDLDSTIATLALSGSAEMRLGSLLLARKHLRAVHHLLLQRGGLHTLQRMSGTTGLETMHVLHQLGSPMILNIPKTLYETIRPILTQLKEMHAWNVTSRSGFSLLETAGGLSQAAHSGLEYETETKTGRKIAGYWVAVRHCLGPSSIIGDCLMPHLKEGSDTATRCQAGSLYCLNSVLYNLRHDQRTAANFVTDLAYIVNNSYNLSSNTYTADEVSLQKLHIATVLPATIVHCAMRYGEWHDGEWRKTLPALRIWESLEFVELVMLMSPQRRYSILSMMHSLLTQDVDQLDGLGLPRELDLEDATQEIWGNWIANKA